MPGVVETILSLQFLLAAGVIFGVTLLAYRLTAPNRDSKSFAAAARHDPPPAYDPNDPNSAPDSEGASTPDGISPRPKIGVAAEQPRVTFADVAGLEDAIAELREVADYLTYPDRFRALGAELPRGILLHGLPGCGKTLLARALAGETGRPFFYVSAASFVEKYVGIGASRVRELFLEAKKHAPSIVFIDELDAIGRARNGDAGGAREFDHTLNQLLVELDGFAAAAGVLLLGATNRIELIDPALLRPGRFDRRIQVDRPDLAGRERILMLHAAKRPFTQDVDWAELAENTAGLSPAELANIVNEAALLAARRHQRYISQPDVDEAADRVLAGLRNSRLMSDDERELIAVHEAGHAMLSLLVKGMRPPARVSIISRSGAFDKSVWTAPVEGVFTKRELMAHLIVLLGGRAAEMNTFGEPSTRAEDDLAHAAGLARRMVEHSAMTGRFELAGTRRDGGSPYVEGSAGGHEVRELVAKAEQAAISILSDHQSAFLDVANALAQYETLTAGQLAQVARLDPAEERLASVHQIRAS